MNLLIPRIVKIQLWLNILGLFCLFVPVNTYSQFLYGEEILRHFDEGEKLVPHIHDQDSFAWGYIFGHDLYYDYEWAEKYQIDGSGLVIGAISHIMGNNPNPDKSSYFSIYNVHKDRKPGEAIYTKKLNYDELKLNGSETRVMFDSSIYVKDSFFVAFAVADYAHDPEVLGEDTIYLLATEEGTRPDEDLKVFGRNCIRTHRKIAELAWIDAYVSDVGRKSVNAFLALFPIMDFSSSANNSNIQNGRISFFKGFYNTLENSIQIQLKAKNLTNISLGLLTMDGRQIISENFNLSANQINHVELNLNQKILSGNYLLVLSGKNTKLAQKIFIN